MTKTKAVRFGEEAWITSEQIAYLILHTEGGIELKTAANLIENFARLYAASEQMGEAGMPTTEQHRQNAEWADRILRSDLGLTNETHIHRQLRKTLNHIRGEWYAMSPETAVQIVKSAIKKLQLKTEVDLCFGWAVPDGR